MIQMMTTIVINVIQIIKRINEVMILFKMKQESFKKKKITIHTNINNMIYKSDGIPKLIPSLFTLISTIWFG